MSLEVISTSKMDLSKYRYCSHGLELLGSAATWEGLDMSAKNLDALESRVEQLSHWKNRRIYVTTGKEMNEYSKLTGDNAYPDDLSIVSIALADVEDCMPLKMQLGARWLDDIISNNEYRERGEEDEEDDWDEEDED